MGVGCGICWLIIGLILFLVSIGTVEPIEYGIVYNSIQKSVNTEEIYAGGWYLIGPVNSFVTFPSTLVNMDFTEFANATAKPIIVKDSDGQEIRLSMSLQYKLHKDDIGKLYTEYKTDYENTFVSYTDSVVRKKVGTFNSTAFWSARKASTELLRDEIDKKLNEVYASCVNL